jgi:hypothetical protein
MNRNLLPAGLLLLIVPLAVADALPPPADPSIPSASFSTVEEDEPLCAQKYEAGVLTTWPCPPETCNVEGAASTLVATGPPGGLVPLAILDCHDASHNLVESYTDEYPYGPPSTFFHGVWWSIKAGGWPNPFGGTPPLPDPTSDLHAHCSLDLRDATFAFVQCIKH